MGEKEINRESGAYLNALPLPNPFRFEDGHMVESQQDWEERLTEIQNLYETQMYGTYPSGEKISYTIEGEIMKVSVTENGVTETIDVKVTLPTKKVYEEAPVLFVYFGFFPEQLNYATERGYAVLAVNPYEIAKDAFPREGIFYRLHPYTEDPATQTGALAAWAWGFSKAMDALQAGAAKELGLSSEQFILTGVSRFGKSTAVAGAFDSRIKVTAPSCSGAGGMALYRYVSEGRAYDFSKVGRPTDYTFQKNEPLSCLCSDSEGHWFNDRFRTFGDPGKLPLEQYMLSALCGRGGRYLFISGSYCDEDWVNSPSMWMNYLAAKELFRFSGNEEKLAVCFHETGHMVTMSDLAYLLDFCDCYLYRKEVSSDFSELRTGLYALPQNRDAVYEAKLAFQR